MVAKAIDRGSLDKTRLGCHGAAILCRADHAYKVDASVRPDAQSSFPVAKVSDTTKKLLELLTALFQWYAKPAIERAHVLAAHLAALLPGSVLGGSPEQYYLPPSREKAFGRNGPDTEFALGAIGVLSYRRTRNDVRVRDRCLHVLA